MARIAYILLCHKAPDDIIAQARRLTAVGDFVAIHLDARAPQAAFDRVARSLADNPRVAFASRRLRCGWGDWSLVHATLLGLEAALSSFPRATHFYLISGDCMPIKSAEFSRQALDAVPKDHIETHDFFASDWIRTGFRDERLIYRHHFNERTQSRLFYASYAVQKRLGITRAPPADLRIMIGSQWWCLRRSTVEALTAFCAARPDIPRFFRTTWIPDETFFQTLVRHLVPAAEIVNRTPTFLIFTDYGMPVNFHDDQYDLLLSQDHFFARKISPEAMDLKARLGELYAASDVPFRISGEGRQLFHYLTGRGRHGRRFATRFWERDSTLGRARELMVVACKKYHVAKRLLDQIRNHTDIPAVGYLFNETEADLPPLGGIASSLQKRSRHRRAVLRLLFEELQSDRLVVCIDPGDLDLIRDFATDRAATRVLEITCRFSDDYLAGHARRVGLAADHSPPDILSRLIPTIRVDIQHESEAIEDAGIDHLTRLREGQDIDDNAAALAPFLSVDHQTARAILSLDHLFAD